ASITSLTATSTPSEVAAGSFRVPVDDVPLDAIGFTATGAEARDVGGLPSRVLPSRVLPSRVLFLQFPDDVLQSLHLSDIPVDGGWEPRLVGTSLEGALPSATTLKQYLALDPPPDLPLSDVDLAHSPLRGLSVAAIATAGASLTDLAA